MTSFDDFIKAYGLETLDPQQRIAAETVNGPVLLLAVPGSGKTTTLIARLGYMIYGCGIPANNILTVTFTVAAAREMEQRFYARFGEEKKGQLFFRTINSLCYRIILAYERQGHRVPRLATEGEQISMLRAAWLECGYGWPTENDLKSFQLVVSSIKNGMLSTEEIRERDWDLQGDCDAMKLYQAYTLSMKDHELMDFDDQMVLAYQILTEDQSILKRVQTQYPYICVDESQDTSRIQHIIISMLAGKSHNLFMVGDEDQSIYGFRAACPEELLNFEKRWPAAKVLFIETNYRSTPQIVDAAARFIRQNGSRRDKNMRAVQKDGMAIQEIPCESPDEQYAALIKAAQEANRNKVETAVLYRNNDTALPIIDQLESQNIPYRAKGVDGLFFTSRLFLDVKAFFALSYDPCDRDAFMTIYSKLGTYMTRENAQAVTRQKGVPILDELVRRSNQTKLADRYREISNTIKELKEVSASAAIELILSALRYKRWLEKQEADTFRVKILTALAKGDSSPKAFLEHMERLKERVKQGANNKNAMFVLSTIHSAKGLEYDKVILADVEDGILPSPSAIKDFGSGHKQGMEEERRLFYVGMTRAKKELYIVTFKDARSQFSQFIFPKKKSLNLTGITRRISGKTAPAPSKQKNPFHAGDIVQHKVFGKGVIISATDEELSIKFGGKVKKLATQYVLDHKMLKPGK